MRESIKGDRGNVIAWVDSPCEGNHPECKRAIRANRPIHIIPCNHDDDYHLALPDYHFASRDEALEALENARNTAIIVDNAIDRDNAYKMRIPVKILKGGKYV